MRIVLAGNPNSGKTTLFNSLTGANQRVGNWPGVTVEKKTGKLRSDKEIDVIDLPGIYSLSPYTAEEEIALKYLLEERPEVIINIVDGTNLERNLYLTTQLLELNIPVVLAINMSDIIKKAGDSIDSAKLRESLQIPVVAISALTGENLQNLIKTAVDAGKQATQMNFEGKTPAFDLQYKNLLFQPKIEKALDQIAEIASDNLTMDPKLKRWYQIKLFERDASAIKELQIDSSEQEKIESVIVQSEEELDDDAESIITAERYNTITKIISQSYQRKNKNKLSMTDRIDRIVTNRILALPIFVAVMFVVYYLSVSTIGTLATDWVNEQLFGEGWFFLGQGRAAYETENEEFSVAENYITSFEEQASVENINPEDATTLIATAKFFDENGELEKTEQVTFSDYQKALKIEEPDPANYGPWVPGLPVLIEQGLHKLHVSDRLQDLVMNGIVAGVGAVLGFVPQMFVLFICLAFLEAIGYMARIAFIMDRIFRRFGLSGKSFIPLMIGTGCSIPGIMAARTIEHERDRRMTVITTSFIPCGAKLPVIALIAGAFFGKSGFLTTGCYFIGIAAVIVSGIILKKSKPFAGDVSPFVIELPAYHLPRLRDILKSAFERSLAFIKHAGTIILLSTVIVWFFTVYGFENGFGRVENIDNSILAGIGNALGFIFRPLGFGNWKAVVATITGLAAKENIVGTFGVLYGLEEVAENGWQIWQNMRLDMSTLAAFSFLLFNLLCAPCFAAIGAIKREMANTKWTLFAITYQTLFAYTICLIIYQFGLFFGGANNLIGFAVALIFTALYLYLLFRPARNHQEIEKVPVLSGKGL